MSHEVSHLCCRNCDVKHVLGEFDIGEMVIVIEGKHAGARGKVVSWTQYGCPIRYRVEFDGYIPDPEWPSFKRENFHLCELVKG